MSRRLQPSPAAPSVARGRRSAFTLVEMVVVVIILGILIGILTVSFSGHKRYQQDRAGWVLLGASQTDASRVANSTGYTFPGASKTIAGLSAVSDASVSHTADGRSLTYTQGPSADSSHVSVAYGDAVTLGFALMSSTNGPTDGHCEFLQHSLKTGPVYSQNFNALAGGINVCQASFALCPTAQLKAASPATADGSAANPYTMPTSCSATPGQTLLPPSCMSASPDSSQLGGNNAAVTLNWIPSSDAGNTASYEIDVTSSTPGVPAVAPITGVDPTSRSKLVDGLTPGAMYTFTLYSVNSTGNKFGPVTSNVNLQLPPAAPVVTVSAAGSGYQITWRAVTGAVSYTISRTPAFTAQPADIPASSAMAGGFSYTDTDNIAVGQQYLYTVTAKIPPTTISQCSVGIQTGGTAVSPNAPSPADAPPTTMTVTMTPNQPKDATFTVNWQAQPGASGYQVEYQTLNYSTVNSANPAALTPWQVVHTDNTGTQTSWAMTGVQFGTVGNFRVEVLYPSGASIPSNTAYAVAPPPAPQMVTMNWPDKTQDGNTPAGVAFPSEFPTGYGTETLTWNPTVATDGYNVIDAATQAIVVAGVPQPATPGPVTVNLTQALGATKTYAVVAYNAQQTGAKQQPSASSNSKQILQYPPDVTMVATSASGSRDYAGYNTPMWLAATSATSYAVERALPSSSTWACASGSCPSTWGQGGGVGSANTTFNDTFGGANAPAGSRYQYRVWAYNATGRSQHGSPNPQSITQVPAAPVLRISAPPAMTNTGTGNTAATASFTANADAGNTATADRWCTAATCQYRFVENTAANCPTVGGVVPFTATGNTISVATWNGDPAGSDRNYYACAQNNAITNGGWSSSSAAATVHLYPGPFSFTGATTNGVSPVNEYPNTSVVNGSQGDSSRAFCDASCPAGSPSADVSWSRSAGAVHYQWNRTGVATQITPYTSTGAVAMTAGGFQYQYNLSAVAANGLVRVAAGGTGTGAALVQSAPTLPRRIGLIQQCGAGGNQWDWALKYYALKDPIANGGGGNIMRIWAVATAANGTRTTSGSTGWQSATGGFSNISPELAKGNDNIVVYFQSGVQRPGDLDPTSLSPIGALKFTSVSYGSWASCMANNDVGYDSQSYVASWDNGYERFSAPGDSWALGRRLPGSEWN